MVGYLDSLSQGKLTGFYYLKKKERKQRQKKKKRILEDIWQHIVFIYEESFIVLDFKDICYLLIRIDFVLCFITEAL